MTVFLLSQDKLTSYESNVSETGLISSLEAVWNFGLNDPLRTATGLNDPNQAISMTPMTILNSLLAWYKTFWECLFSWISTPATWPILAFRKYKFKKNSNFQFQSANQSYTSLGHIPNTSSFQNIRQTHTMSTNSQQCHFFLRAIDYKMS